MEGKFHWPWIYQERAVRLLLTHVDYLTAMRAGSASWEATVQLAGLQEAGDGRQRQHTVGLGM